MRGLERDELVTAPTREDQREHRVMQRFLEPRNDPLLSECFLISTSAGDRNSRVPNLTSRSSF